MAERDIFRPRLDPARTIYDAFQREAKLRETRSPEEWTEAEALAMQNAAREQARALGLRVPRMYEMLDAESSARGHIDYGAQWAYRVVELMRGGQGSV